MATLEYVAVPGPKCATGVVDAVELAWFERRPLRMRYLSARGEESERTVRIERLILDLRETQLHCHDLDKDAPRQFLMHRILRAKVL